MDRLLTETDEKLAELGQWASRELAAAQAEIIRLNGTVGPLMKILDGVRTLLPGLDGAAPGEEPIVESPPPAPVAPSGGTHRTLTDLACPDCGQSCRGGAGLAAHRRHRHSEVVAVPAERQSVIDLIEADQPTEAEIDLAMAAPSEAGGKHRFHGEHRSVNEGTKFGGKRVYCECGWITAPFPERSQAREAFATHLDEMAMARGAV